MLSLSRCRSTPCVGDVIRAGLVPPLLQQAAFDEALFLWDVVRNIAKRCHPDTVVETQADRLRKFSLPVMHLNEIDESEPPVQPVTGRLEIHVLPSNPSTNSQIQQPTSTQLQDPHLQTTVIQSSPATSYAAAVEPKEEAEDAIDEPEPEEEIEALPNRKQLNNESNIKKLSPESHIVLTSDPNASSESTLKTARENRQSPPAQDNNSVVSELRNSCKNKLGDIVSDRPRKSLVNGNFKLSPGLDETSIYYDASESVLLKRDSGEEHRRSAEPDISEDNKGNDISLRDKESVR